MSEEKKQKSGWIWILIEAVIVAALAVMFVTGNHLPSKDTNITTSPAPTETLPEALPIETEPEGSEAPTAEPLIPTEIPTDVPTPTPAMIDPIDYFLADTSQERYAQWIRALSGELPVTIDGQEATITTRYSYAMFGGQENAQAPDYLMEQGLRLP